MKNEPATTIEQLEDALEGRGDLGSDTDDDGAGSATGQDAEGTATDDTTPPAADEGETPGARTEPTVTKTEPVPAGAPDAKTYTVPNDPRFGALAGKKATEQEIITAGLLSTLLSSEHQDLHHMKKYQEEIVPMRQRLEQLEAQAKAREAPPTAKPEPEWSPEKIKQVSQQIESTFMPQIEKYAKAGGIEEEATILYPKMLSTIEYRFQAGQQMLDVLTKGLAALAADWLERNQSDGNNQARNVLEGTMSKLAEKGGLEDLSDADVRESFGTWMASQEVFRDAKATSIDERLMKAAFLAFLDTEDGQKITAQRKAAAPSPPRRRDASLAGGGSRSGGGAPSKKPPTSGVAAFVEAVEQLERGR